MVKKSHRKKIEDKRMWRNKKNIPEEESLSEKIRAISLFGLVYDPRKKVYCPENCKLPPYSQQR